MRGTTTGAPARSRETGRCRHLLAAAVIGCLALVLPGAPPAGAQAAPGDTYVALGDSATSGPLIPMPTGLLGCGRSDHNYPHLTAGALGLGLTDVSCGGAATRHMTQPQSVEFDGVNPPQFDALHSDTDLVSLGIGGNDTSWSSVINKCVEVGWYWPFGSPCANYYRSQSGGDPNPPMIDAVGPKVAEVVQGIHQRSPQAEVFVVGYGNYFPTDSTSCWPSVPIARGDQRYLDDLNVRLNSVIKAAAQANGATYVDIYTPGLGHDACRSAGTRWIEPYVPGSAAMPWHPNLRGMENASRQLQAAMVAG